MNVCGCNVVVSGGFRCKVQNVVSIFTFACNKSEKIAFCPCLMGTQSACWIMAEEVCLAVLVVLHKLSSSGT